MAAVYERCYENITVIMIYPGVVVLLLFWFLFGRKCFQLKKEVWAAIFWGDTNCVGLSRVHIAGNECLGIATSYCVVIFIDGNKNRIDR